MTAVTAVTAVVVHKKTKDQGANTDMGKTKAKGWQCPHCPQTSSRPWNVKVHIKRAHDGMGHPIETISSSASSIATKRLAPSMNSTEIRNNFYRGLPDNRGFHDSAYQNINRRENEARSRGSLDEFQRIVHESIEWIRPFADLQDLVRRFSPSTPQQSAPSLLQLFLIAGGELPTGYRIRFCDKCLDGNICEPVAASIQMEALAKDFNGHVCMPEALATINQQQNKGDLLKRVHEDIFSILTDVVNIRLRLKGTQNGAYLKSQELDKEFLMQYPNTTFPLGVINRTWIKQEEFIDLDLTINRHNIMNKEDRWAIRAIKKEGQQAEKITKIDFNELKEFLRITKATFGAFRVRVGDDGPVRCFLMSVMF